jgi:hypothetical protein
LRTASARIVTSRASASAFSGGDVAGGVGPFVSEILRRVRHLEAQ